MSLSNSIQLALTIITALSALITFYFSRKNLKMSIKVAELSYKADIVFFIEPPDKGGRFHKLVLKNFGKACGTLLYMNISPKLSCEKSLGVKGYEFTKSKNILLTPGESICSCFNLQTYDDRIFKIEVIYESNGQTYTNKYTLNLSYIDSVLLERITPL